MKTFFIRFDGYWPVGACAVVSALSDEIALELFKAKLAENHPKLVDKNKDISLNDVIDIDDNSCSIPLDGNY